jgi:O-antigen ligase
VSPHPTVNLPSYAHAPRSLLHRGTAFAFGTSLALPLLLPIPGFEAIPPLAQGVTLASIFAIAAQLGGDVARPRRGGGLRLVIYCFVAAAITSFVAGCVLYGVDGSALVSLLNWVALGGLVIAAQGVLVSRRDVDRMLNVLVNSYVVLSIALLAYLLARFGAQIFVSTNRGPFQLAARALMPAWPNYYGVAAAVAITVVYGRLLTGMRGRWTIAQLSVLFVVLLATFSRGSLLACLVGMGVMTVVSGRLRRAMPLFVASILVLAMIASLLPGVRYQFVATFTPGTSQNIGVLERLAFAAEAIRLWKQHPLVGIGFHQFVELAEVSRVTTLGGTGAALGSVHNEYITTLLKGGLLVMATFLALIAMALRRFRQLARSSDQDLRRLGVVGLGMAAVLLVAGLTLESLRTVLISAPFWALLGGLDALRLRQHAATPTFVATHSSPPLAPSPSQ